MDRARLSNSDSTWLNSMLVSQLLNAQPTRTPVFPVFARSATPARCTPCRTCIEVDVASVLNIAEHHISVHGSILGMGCSRRSGRGRTSTFSRKPHGANQHIDTTVSFCICCVRFSCVSLHSYCLVLSWILTNGDNIVLLSKEFSMANMDTMSWCEKPSNKIRKAKKEGPSPVFPASSRPHEVSRNARQVATARSTSSCLPVEQHLERSWTVSKKCQISSTALHTNSTSKKTFGEWIWIYSTGHSTYTAFRTNISSTPFSLWGAPVTCTPGRKS